MMFKEALAKANELAKDGTEVRIHSIPGGTFALVGPSKEDESARRLWFQQMYAP